ncbi:MAG: ankyrin repeat domain-containing protein [Gammaproteobacteria bacterium]
MSASRPSLEDLESAVYEGNYELARHLIEDCKLDPNDIPFPADDFKESILEKAVSFYPKMDSFCIKKQANSEKIFDLLVNAGVDVAKHGVRVLNHVISEWGWQQDPSAMKMRINIINKVLDKKVDINSVLTYNNHTALLLATDYGNKELCEVLLSRGASLTSKMTNYFDFRTPISVAIAHTHFTLAEQLLDHAIIQAKDGKCDLKEAIGPAIVFFSSEVKETQLPLLKKLIDNKADVNATDNYGRNALRRLIQFNNLHKTLAKEIMSVLLNNGIDTINLYKGEVILTMAIRQHYPQDLIKMLGDYNTEKRKLLNTALYTSLFTPLRSIVDEYAEDYERAEKPAPSLGTKI